MSFVDIDSSENFDVFQLICKFKPEELLYCTRKINKLSDLFQNFTYLTNLKIQHRGNDLILQKNNKKGAKYMKQPYQFDSIS